VDLEVRGSTFEGATAMIQVSRARWGLEVDLEVRGSMFEGGTAMIQVSG
jgi:hypothetical protein